MVEISVQIVFHSVPISKGEVRFKVKTWWAHVDVDDGINFIKLPNLPMIEHYYNMSGKETIIFIEVWYRNLELYPTGSMRFLGLAKCPVDDLLRNPNRNPSVEWLEVYDPIENIIRGRLLLKVDAKFSPPATPESANNLPSKESISYGPPSSYFHRPSTNGSSATTSTTSSPRKISVPVQTETETVPVVCGPTGLPTSLNEDKEIKSRISSSSHPEKSARPCVLSNAKPKTRKVSLDVDKEKANQRKKVTVKVIKPSQPQPFTMTVAGKTYTIQKESSVGHTVVATTCVPLPKYKGRKQSESTTTSQTFTKSPQINENKQVNSSDSSIDNVITLLNENFNKININSTNSNELKSCMRPQESQIVRKNSNDLRFQNHKSRIRSETESSSSPFKYNEKIAPETLSNEKKTDSSDFSPCGYPRVNAKVMGRSVTSVDLDHIPLLSLRSTADSISSIFPEKVQCIQKESDITDSGRPQRSRRIAAAIFNDAFI